MNKWIVKVVLYQYKTLGETSTVNNFGSPILRKNIILEVVRRTLNTDDSRLLYEERLNRKGLYSFKFKNRSIYIETNKILNVNKVNASKTWQCSEQKVQSQNKGVPPQE